MEKFQLSKVPETVQNWVFGGEEEMREAPKRKWGVGAKRQWESEEFCIFLERVGLLLLSQADTERVVKIIRKVEPRFAAFNEVKESKGARDRAQHEIFLHENKIALKNLPLDELFAGWS